MKDPGLRMVASPIDGIPRALITEGQLNLTAARLFASGGGRDFLDYLKSITIQRICGPEASSEELRHREGARWLVGVIQQRISAGQKHGAVNYGRIDDEDPAPAA